MLIGVLPLVFLTYIAFQLYQEKTQRAELLQLYTRKIYQAETLSKLIDALQNERKLSFDRSINKELGRGLQNQRSQTDTLILLLKKDNDIALLKFEEYTFLDELAGIRKSIDQNKASSSQIMDSYTNMIFRLNTLNTSFPGTQVFLKPITNDLAAQRILTEMLTYLGIIRSNIFNVLHSKAYVVETLIGTYGVHKVYHSYEREFAIKAPTEINRLYEKTKQDTKLKPTLDYIDTVFKRFSFDSTYNSDSWWQVSNDGINSLRTLQHNIWQSTKEKIGIILQNETREKNLTLVFLVIALTAVVLLVSYTLHTISSVLKELKNAAVKIAAGDPDVKIDINTNDAIGSLAESVRKMEKQVRERTSALQQANIKLESSNRELEQFAYVASHDLQEPVRKIRTFADRLMVDHHDKLGEDGRKVVDKIAASAERMKMLINDILEFSQLDKNRDEIKPVDLNMVLSKVITDLELMISQKQAIIKAGKLPVIEAIPVQINQLFYNMLNNALKFSKESIPPAIEIFASDAPQDHKSSLLGKPKYTELYIKDNGIGFSQEHAEKIFEMFQRLTAERSGTGIGLALCKKIIENHKGSIEAKSTEGEGTTFKITLPLHQS